MSVGIFSKEVEFKQFSIVVSLVVSFILAVTFVKVVSKVELNSLINVWTAVDSVSIDEESMISDTVVAIVVDMLLVVVSGVLSVEIKFVVRLLTVVSIFKLVVWYVVWIVVRGGVTI